MQFGAVPAPDAPHIMPGSQRRGAEVARRLQQIAKLDPLIAADAGDGGFAAGVAVDEIVDHGGAKPALIVEHIMRDAEALGNTAAS